MNRLSTPLAEGCGAIEPFPDRRSPTQPREVCFERRFVDENLPVRLRAHAGLTVRDPITAGLTQRRSITFRRDQSFFYMTARPVRARGAAKKAAPLRHVFRPGHRLIP